MPPRPRRGLGGKLVRLRRWRRRRGRWLRRQLQPELVGVAGPHGSADTPRTRYNPPPPTTTQPEQLPPHWVGAIPARALRRPLNPRLAGERRRCSSGGGPLYRLKDRARPREAAPERTNHRRVRRRRRSGLRRQRQRQHRRTTAPGGYREFTHFGGLRRPQRRRHWQRRWWQRGRQSSLRRGRQRGTHPQLSALVKWFAKTRRSWRQQRQRQWRQRKFKGQLGAPLVHYHLSAQKYQPRLDRQHHWRRRHPAGRSGGSLPRGFALPGAALLPLPPHRRPRPGGPRRGRVR
jgi:hypothetical protein